MIVNLFNQLEGVKTISGTWTSLDTTVPSPAPPGTYNGTIDLTGFSAGVYGYRYTVSSSPVTVHSDLFINYNNPPQVFNDEQANSTLIATHNLLKSGSTSVEDLFLTDSLDCINGRAATASVSPVSPPAWQLALSADIWFKVKLPTSNPSPISIIVSLSSFQYTPQNLSLPMLALYRGSTLSDAAGPVGPPELLSTILTVPVNNTEDYMYIRVGIPQDSGGFFRLLIQTNI